MRRSVGRRTAECDQVLSALLAAGLFAYSVRVTLAADPPTTGDEVLARARRVSASVHDRSMRLVMRIRDDEGEELVRRLRGYDKQTAEGRKLLWVFEAPTELAGTSFLAWQRPGETDALWVYFSGQRRVRRIPPSLRRDRFHGSSFTYEDMAAVFHFDYSGQNSLIGSESCGTASCFVVATDLPADAFAYRRLKSWFRADNYLPDHVEFFDSDGKVMKTMRVLRSEEIGGVPTVTQMEMSTPGDSSRTRVELSELRFNEGLADGLFEVSQLNRGR